MIPVLGIGVAMVLLLAASVSDLAARSIPNWMPVALGANGLVMQIDARHVLASVLAMMIVFVIATWCWRRGLMGGGDVKLLAAASLVVRPSAVGMLVVTIALSGGVLAVFYSAMRHLLRVRPTRRPRQWSARILQRERRRIRSGSIPYAVAIAGGTGYILGTGLAA
jgi:prepilin peptidase CpaA